MLDIRFIRENADLVQESARQKGYDVDVKTLLGHDQRRRELQKTIDDLRTERNENSAKMKGGKPSEEMVAAGKKIKTELASLEDSLGQIETEFNSLHQLIPNIIFDDVPLGGEEDSVEIKKWGEQKTGAKDHLDFAKSRGWVHFERGAKAAGAKFYYLKGDLALLENALLQFGLKTLSAKGFTYLTVPHLVNSRTAEGAGFAPKGDSGSNEYFIDGEDLTLIGTAEAPLTAFHADEILAAEDMPIRYVGYSPCYRKEAGTYGKHTRGLFRVHQFNKLEMYVFCLPDQSQKMHEEILANEEEIWQALGVPYHVINIAAGDLGAPAAKKFDLEYWSPVDETYREITSCSNCTDFQAQGLNIRVRQTNGGLVLAHTLNGTAISMARALVAIIENYQLPDGKLAIPEVLQPYMGGRTEI